MHIFVRKLLRGYNGKNVRRNANFFREEIETDVKEKKCPKGKFPSDHKIITSSGERRTKAESNK
jgi:hypothetical protein